MNACCVDEYDLCIYQGATYTRVFTWRQESCCGAMGSAPAPVDITGYTAAMQIRAYELSTDVLYDATPDLVINGPAGTVTLTIPASDTAGFTWWNGVYDLLLTSSTGFATPLVRGTVTIAPRVTT